MARGGTMQSAEREKNDRGLLPVERKADPRPDPDPARPVQMRLFPVVVDPRPDADRLRRIAYL
ncbi:MAG: hypothetical protein WC713_01360 [Candidatus Methylomirabilota bacterium]